MILLKYKNLNKNLNKKLKSKICQESGCGKEYLGSHISKFCDFHRDPKNRKRKRKVYGPDENNRKFKHIMKDRITMIFNCSLLGCKKEFKVKVFPGVYVYPKYCEEHRNEYKRILFNRRNKCH